MSRATREFPPVPSGGWEDVPRRIGKGGVVIDDDDDDCKRLREAWIERVRRYYESKTGRQNNYLPSAYIDGGRLPGDNKIHKSRWPEFLKAIQKTGLDLHELLESLFSVWQSDSLPLPSTLASPSNVERALNRREARTNVLRTSLQSEEAAFMIAEFRASASIASPVEARKFALRDYGAPMSPLFRYCVARLDRLDDVAEQWRDLAVVQFNRDVSIYREFWFKILPSELLDSE